MGLQRVRHDNQATFTSLLYFLILYWSVIDLQYWGSFRCTTKWFSYTYTCTCAVCSVTFNSVTPWVVASQAPLSMKFSGQHYWSPIHMHISIFSFRLFSHLDYYKYWVEFSVLYSRSLLIIYFTYMWYINLKLLMCASPLVFPFGNYSVFSLSVSLFLFCK